MKIVIVGAGIAGLAVGWELAKAGAEVEILDRGLAGHGATWASGGMLAPGAELGAEDSALARFAHASRHAWNGFAEALEERFESPVERFDPFKKIPLNPVLANGHDVDLTATAAVAVGLALRKAGDQIGRAHV